MYYYVKYIWNICQYQYMSDQNEILEENWSKEETWPIILSLSLFSLMHIGLEKSLFMVKSL